VPAITFEKCLDLAGVSRVDFLSINLEGFELEALSGWNFERHRPQYILIEVRDLKAVDVFLSIRAYSRIDHLVRGDYLYVDNRLIVGDR